MSIEERRNLVVSFLRRCVRYANPPLARNLLRGSADALPLNTKSIPRVGGSPTDLRI